MVRGGVLNADALMNRLSTEEEVNDMNANELLNPNSNNTSVERFGV